jgi:hypothetical protein
MNRGEGWAPYPGAAIFIQGIAEGAIMDLSDLSPSARDRIAAVEIEADSIAANARASANHLVETYQFGVDPLGIDRVIYGDSLAVRAARDELASGREGAAGHLFGATAGEYLKARKLDIEGFNAKLNTIGDWIVRKYGIDHAVLEQMKQECRKLALRKRAAALEAGEASNGTIIAKLPADALVRMEADTAAFLADYLPKLEREANRSGPIHDAELLRELVIHQFNLVARECMAVCGSVAEFEAEVHSDIARFVLYGLSQYRWLSDAMRKELDRGFALFVMRANPWAEIPEKDRASVWHVGAITGEALTHAALKLRAEAWKHAADGGFPEAKQAGAAEPGGNEPTRTETGPAVNPLDGNGADRRAAVEAYIEEVFSRTGKRITKTDIWKSARYKSRTEFERWERNDLEHPNKTANQRFTRILTEKPHLK